jgi:hypothetical protein
MASKKLTPIQSIKGYCKRECSANDLISWKECPSEKCPLFPYHLGRRPITKPFSEYIKKHRDLPLNFSKETIVQAGIGVKK